MKEKKLLLLVLTLLCGFSPGCVAGHSQLQEGPYVTEYRKKVYVPLWGAYCVRMDNTYNDGVLVDSRSVGESLHVVSKLARNQGINPLVIPSQGFVQVSIWQWYDNGVLISQALKFNRGPRW